MLGKRKKEQPEGKKNLKFEVKKGKASP